MKTSTEYALMIENLLEQISGFSNKGEQALIRTTPYNYIDESLNYLELSSPLKKEKIEYFRRGYQGIKNQSIDDLINDNYNLDLMLKELGKLIQE